MKTLTEYINELDYFDNQVLIHSQTHIGFHENEYYRCPQCYTFESIGLFPMCKDIIKYFVDNFDKEHIVNKWVIKSKDICNGLFFDELRLYFDNDSDKNVHGYYVLSTDGVPDNIEWNEKYKKFNFIDIYLYNTNNAPLNDTIEILTHELQHAWDDYIIRANGGSFTEKHKKIIINSQILIKKLKDNLLDKNSNDISIFEKLLYYLDKFEKSSYIAQINGSVYNKTFKDPREALEYIKSHCPTYENYKIIYELFNDKRYKDKLMGLGVDEKTFEKYRKLSNYIWSKVVNHTYQIIIQHVRYDSVNENVSIKLNNLLIDIYNR